MYTPVELINQIQEKVNKYNFIKSTLETKEVQKKSKEETLSLHNSTLEEINQIMLACKLILEKITYQNKVKIEEFITYALQNIFTDRDYRIELEIKEDTKRPALTMMLVENGIKQDIKDAVGGGIITTLGFLLQIYYLEVYNKNKIMFIDEGLKEVSKLDQEAENIDYLGNLLQFLKWLSEDRGYKFVVVTHDDTVREVADTVYRVRLGEVEKIK